MKLTWDDQKHLWSLVEPWFHAGPFTTETLFKHLPLMLTHYDEDKFNLENTLNKEKRKFSRAESRELISMILKVIMQTPSDKRSWLI